MDQIMTLEELREYIHSMPEDEILIITVESEEDEIGRDNG